MMRTPKQVIQLLKEKLTPNLQKKVGNVLFGSLNTIALETLILERNIVKVLDSSLIQ